MKITELRCSACDGTLKLDEQNSGFAECEYCHTRYMIEWEHPGMAGNEDVHLKQVPQKIAYTPIREKKEEKKSGWEPYGWKRGTALVILFFVLFGIMYVPKVYKRYQADHGAETGDEAAYASLSADAGKTGNISEDETQQAEPAVKLEGLLAEFAETVFGKPVEEITDKELAKIKWLELKTGIDYRQVGYSFEDSLDHSKAELTWLKFPRDDYSQVQLECLSAFSGLKRISTSQTITAEDVKGLSLSGISGYFDNLEEIAAIVEDTEQIRYLNITGSSVSLQGFEQFPNLESLILNCDAIGEEKNLVSMKSLKYVMLDMYNGTMDFSVFGMMPWLEELSISSENLRDLGFLTKMTGLKAFSAENGTFLTLAPLSDCQGLTELSLENCNEVKDMAAVSSLTGLKKLKLELPYGCPQPDLSGLTALTELSLESFDDTGFLKYMSSLEELTLASCSVSSSSDFEGLTSLKKLSCTSFAATARDYGFVTSLPALEELDLHGTSTYDDISGIFNMATLKRLNINNMQCEIDFDKIGENTTLESLSIDHIKLYENVQVSGGGGIVYVDWDDVNFTEHLAFFEKLQALEELSIRENQLTDIGFAASLNALKTIDFSDNYVTDLSPLSGLKALSEAVCSENPIANYDVLGESVAVVR